MSAFGTLVVQFEQKVLRDLMLDAEIPVLHVGHRQITGDGVLRSRPH